MKKIRPVWKHGLFWGCLLLVLMDTAIPLIALGAFWILLCTLIPRLGMVTSLVFIKHYNSVFGTQFEILDISRSEEKIQAQRFQK